MPTAVFFPWNFESYTSLFIGCDQIHEYLIYVNVWLWVWHHYDYTMSRLGAKAAYFSFAKFGQNVRQIFLPIGHNDFSRNQLGLPPPMVILAVQCYMQLM